MNEKPAAMVEPFHGTVNVRFSDAIIASTKQALVLREEGRDPAYFIPFRDVYFEFLVPSPREEESRLDGKVRYWNVEAVGAAENDVMWVYDQPGPQLASIRQHGTFDPAKVRIDALPSEDLIHTPHAP